jgi:ferredoxin
MRTPSTSPTRLHIDWTRCHGRGLCTEVLPRLLGRDAWGYPIARDGSREPAVPSSALSEARTAVDLCPRLALSLITDVNRGPGNRKAGTSL